MRNPRTDVVYLGMGNRYYKFHGYYKENQATNMDIAFDLMLLRGETFGPP